MTEGEGLEKVRVLWRLKKNLGRNHEPALAGSGGTMGTRNTVTRTIFGENALTLHFLGLASSGCFDYVVAFAPTALNMTEGEGGLYCDVVGWGRQSLQRCCQHKFPNTLSC
jgi:hypothetical protein